MPGHIPTTGRRDAAGFAATRWTLVLAARGKASARASDAMAELCRIYWYPLYAYLRRRGHDAHDAEDLTQEFFLRMLDKDYLADVEREKGKFRAFLLASLKHFLANQRDRQQAQKRGGRQVVIPLDALSAESRYRLEPASNLTPERLFERQWAITVLERVLAQLQAELAAEGKQTLFDTLKPFLTGSGRSGYAQAAGELAMTEAAVRVAVHRLRRRYRQRLRDEIGQTVASLAEIDEEIRYLLSCL